VFLSLFQRGNPHHAGKMSAFWQHVLRETLQIQHERSSFSKLFMNDEVFLALLDS